MNLTFLGEYVPDQPRDTSGMHVFGLKKYHRQTTVLEIKDTVRLSFRRENAAVLESYDLCNQC